MIKLASLKTIYKIFASQFEGQPTLLAIVDGENITGIRAEQIRVNLMNHGWPKVAPDEICNNGYIFTQVVQVPARL
jgi:hypothetical protein